MDEAIPAGVCPRCEDPLQEIVVPGEGGEGLYRGMGMRAQRCARCGTGWVDVTRFAPRPLAGTILERERSATREGCPKCRASMLRLTLSWGDEWVQIEECAGCRLVAVQPGEYPRLRVLLASAADILRGGG